MLYYENNEKKWLLGLKESIRHLVLLLKAVAVRRFHQVDVLQEVGHSDGRVQLPSLVRGLRSLAVVSSNVQKAAVLCSGATVVLVWQRKVTVKSFSNYHSKAHALVSPLWWKKKHGSGIDGKLFIAAKRREGLLVLSGPTCDRNYVPAQQEKNRAQRLRKSAE